MLSFVKPPFECLCVVIIWELGACSHNISGAPTYLQITNAYAHIIIVISKKKVKYLLSVSRGNGLEQ